MKVYEKLTDEENRNRWKEHGMRTRFKNGHKTGMTGRHHTNEAKKKMSITHKNKHVGEKNCNWRGGVSKLGYPFGFNYELKELIRKRDRHTCQRCGVPQLECIKKLDIHHKDENKNNLNPENLISLCRQCHTFTNRSNRDIKRKEHHGIF